jgi:hypothetical protein
MCGGGDTSLCSTPDPFGITKGGFTGGCDSRTQSGMAQWPRLWLFCKQIARKITNNFEIVVSL